MSKRKTVYFGLGSNLEAPCSQIIRALTALAADPSLELVACSSLYRTPPMGPQDQPWFVNAVAQFTTTLSPETLLDTTQRLERSLGRIKTRHWGPRLIDIDILLYNNHQLSSERLTLPHPGLTVRSFVVLPLAELDPDLQLPCGQPLAAFIQQFEHDIIERI